MPKWFNTASPCQADIHYMLPPTARLPELVPLIQQRNYFVIHAPRQVGKTTAMLALAQELTESEQYLAVMLSLEVGAAFSDDPLAAEGDGIKGLATGEARSLRSGFNAVG